MALSGREKATILLSILGADASSKILDYLPDDMADMLASGVNNLPKPSPEMLTSIMNEFKNYVSLPPGGSRAQAAPSPQASSAAKPKAQAGTPADVLSRASGRMLVPILLRERPQTIAFVLNQLSDQKTAEILTYLPEQRREIEYLLNTIKENPLIGRIKKDLLASVASRLS